MQIVWSEEIKEALERVCAYAHKYRVDVTITFGADGDAELRVEPTYWDKDTADTPQTEMDKCYKCKWWNYSYGCSNKKGICDFEPIADTPQEERNEK